MQIRRGETCEVCNDIIKFSHRTRKSTLRVCGAADCRSVSLHIERMHPSATKSYLRQHQKRVGKNREAAAARLARIKRQEAVEAAGDLRIKSAVLLQVEANVTPVVTIQSPRQACSPPPPDRIEIYSRYLTDVIGRAQKDTVEPIEGEEKIHRKQMTVETLFNAEPVLRILSDQVCAVCEGGCCVQGENTAYLTPRTIHRFMDANPTMSPDDVHQAYVDRIPTETVTDSCINQSPTGCALPREMRSDTCNSYYCDGLTNWHDSPPEQRGDQLLVVRRTKKLWGAYPGDPNDVMKVAIVDCTGTADVTDTALASLETSAPASGDSP